MSKTVPLKMIASVSTGFPFKGEHYGDTGLRVVRGENVTVGSLRWDSTKRWDNYFNKSSQYSLHAGDIVIGMDGSRVGKNRAQINKIDLPLLLAQRVACVRSSDLSDQNFLYYLIRSDAFEQYVNRIQTGSSIPHISQTQIEKFPVPLWPKITQQKIAAVLSSLDAKIACNNRINAELEAMARTLYDYWFVQFDFPFDFALGRPVANGKPYKSSGGKMVYNSTLKREIPAGWLHSTIGETFKTHLGGTPSREKEEYWNPGEVNWLSSGENPSTFVVDPDERISNLGLQNSPAKLLPPGTVILSIVRHLRASILGIEAATNQSVVGIIESGVFKHCFIYPYIVREIPRLMVLRTGAQQPHINKGVLDESALVVPDESTLKAYTSLAAPLFLQIKNYHQQNRELTQLRDWLLPMLMNGQVTVA